jgi:hypothetical protein
MAPGYPWGRQSRGSTLVHSPGPRDVAQPGSAPALGAGGRRFESARPDLVGRRGGDEGAGTFERDQGRTLCSRWEHGARALAPRRSWSARSPAVCASWRAWRSVPPSPEAAGGPRRRLRPAPSLRPTAPPRWGASTVCRDRTIGLPASAFPRLRPPGPQRSRYRPQLAAAPSRRPMGCLCAWPTAREHRAPGSLSMSAARTSDAASPPPGFLPTCALAALRALGSDRGCSTRGRTDSSGRGPSTVRGESERVPHRR